MTASSSDLAAPEPISAVRHEPLRRTWLRNTWGDLVYVHWAVDPDLIQASLPDGVRVDTFDDRAYVSLIPFQMTDAMVRGLPAIPGVSNFAETNVRTYVVDSKGHRAIGFFSLEAVALPIVAFARWLLGFPYVWSRMSIERSGGDRDGTRRYRTERRRWPRRPGATTELEVEIGQRIETPSDLDVFLSARWGTVAEWPRRSGRIWYHPVDHDEWTLFEARILHLDDESISAAGLPRPDTEPIVRYALPVHARFGRPQRVTSPRRGVSRPTGRARPDRSG